MSEHRARRDHTSHVPKQYVSLHAVRTLLEIHRIFALPDYDAPARVERLPAWQ
jgi:hypothetical protein